MKLPTALCAAVLLLAHAPAEDAKGPGIVHRLLHPFGGKKGATAEKAESHSGKVAIALKLDPQPLKLSAANRLKVTLTLTNRAKKLEVLEFPTSQRIEVLIKNAVGKTIEQWSQDQQFAKEPTVVTINPGERVEYTVEVATRDLVAGQPFTVEGFFASHDTLKAQTALVPEK